MSLKKGLVFIEHQTESSTQELKVKLFKQKPTNSVFFKTVYRMENQQQAPFLSHVQFLQLQSWSAQRAKYTALGGKCANPNKETVQAYLTLPANARRKLFLKLKKKF